MERYEAGFCTKTKERKQKGERRPLRCQMRRTHCIEGQRPTSALQNSEAQKNCERSEMRDKQIQETGAADLGDAMLCRDKEIGGERHHFPREHECIGIVREQHESHACKKHVVLQAQKAGRRALPSTEVARAEN